MRTRTVPPPPPSRPVFLPWLLLSAWFATAFAPAPAAADPEGGWFDRKHPRLARVLQEHVAEGRVDYRRLKADPRDLDAYLGEVAAVASETFDAWTREDRLALLLNLYNAATLRLILDHYPLRGIRDIGLLPGAAWKRRFVAFQDRTWTLDEIEHDLVRRRFGEPRIHFALVCAAVSCPALRDEPYLGPRLDAQLDDQARRFLARPDCNRYDPATRTLWLSPIFEWYAEDFRTANRTVADFVRPYLPPETAALVAGNPSPPTLRYTEYDWRLNERPRPPETP